MMAGDVASYRGKVCKQKEEDEEEEDDKRATATAC